MQFVVIGFDGDDKDALKRRMKVRPEHIAMGDKLRNAGNLWYAAALLDEDGNMKGSLYVVDFPSRADLQGWLDEEPYVVGDVWRQITIHRSNTRDPWQFNREREFFENDQNKAK